EDLALLHVEAGIGHRRDMPLAPQPGGKGVGVDPVACRVEIVSGPRPEHLPQVAAAQHDLGRLRHHGASVARARYCSAASTQGRQTASFAAIQPSATASSDCPCSMASIICCWSSVEMRKAFSTSCPAGHFPAKPDQTTSFTSGGMMQCSFDWSTQGGISIQPTSTSARMKCGAQNIITSGGFAASAARSSASIAPSEPEGTAVSGRLLSAMIVAAREPQSAG